MDDSIDIVPRRSKRTRRRIYNPSHITVAQSVITPPPVKLSTSCLMAMIERRDSRGARRQDDPCLSWSPMTADDGAGGDHRYDDIESVIVELVSLWGSLWWRQGTGPG